MSDPSLLPLWEPCHGCGEMQCNRCDCHTGDAYCDCPGIEELDAIGIDPYAPGSLAQATKPGIHWSASNG